jgi:hypothetical protein
MTVSISVRSVPLWCYLSLFLHSFFNLVPLHSNPELPDNSGDDRYSRVSIQP